MTNDRRPAPRGMDLGVTPLLVLLSFASALGCATGEAPFDADEGDTQIDADQAQSPEGGIPGGDAADPGDAPGSEGARQDGHDGQDGQVGQDGATGGGDADAKILADSGTGPTDATSDQGAQPGVRCGGGSSGTVWCTGATPLCCQTKVSGGATAYACTTSSGCSGYAIACASTSDCAPAHACCHYNSGIKCEPQCPNVASVCDPSASNACPSPLACTLPLMNDGVGSPYMGCQ